MLPFGRIVRLIARGPDLNSVRRYLDDLAAALRDAAPSSVRLLGPAPGSPVEKIKDLYRVHLQLRAPTPRPLQEVLQAVLLGFPDAAGVEPGGGCRSDRVCSGIDQG